MPPKRARNVKVEAPVMAAPLSTEISEAMSDVVDSMPEVNKENLAYEANVDITTDSGVPGTTMGTTVGGSKESFDFGSEVNMLSQAMNASKSIADDQNLSFSMASVSKVEDPGRSVVLLQAASKSASFGDERHSDTDQTVLFQSNISAKTSAKKRTTLSQKAGLTLPVRRIHNQLKKGRYAHKIRIGAAVYLAATLQYLVEEVMDITGEAAGQNKKKRINPRHMTLALRSDEEFKTLLSNVTISEGGVLPHIESILLPKRTSSIKSGKKSLS